MKPYFTLAAVLLTLHPMSGIALELSGDAAQRLGVRAAQPEQVPHAVVAAGTGLVIAAPTGDRVVGALTGGMVQELLAATGDRLSAGDPLLVYQSSEQLGLQRDYLLARRGAELAQAQQRRDRTLFEEGIISERRLQESVSTRRSAERDLERLRLSLLQLGWREADLAALTEDTQLTASLTLRAPASGTLVQLPVLPGSTFERSEPLARIVDLNTLWLETPLSLAAAERIQHGMAVRRRGGGTPVGTVIQVMPLVDPERQTRLVRIAVTGGAPLRLGEYVAVEFLAAPPDGTLVWALPSRALVYENGACSVFLLQGTVLSRQQVTLIGSAEETAYVAGWNGDAPVVQQGVAALKAYWESAADTTP